MNLVPPSTWNFCKVLMIQTTTNNIFNSFNLFSLFFILHAFPHDTFYHSPSSRTEHGNDVHKVRPKAFEPYHFPFLQVITLVVSKWVWNPFIFHVKCEQKCDVDFYLQRENIRGKTRLCTCYLALTLACSNSLLMGMMTRMIRRI